MPGIPRPSAHHQHRSGLRMPKMSAQPKGLRSDSHIVKPHLPKISVKPREYK